MSSTVTEVKPPSGGWWPRTRGRRPGRDARSDRRARPRPDLAALAEVGIDMRQVTDALLADGLRQFEVALGRRLAGIDERSMAVITRRPPTIRAKLSPDLRGALGAGYTLGTLIAAQAAGDLQALRAHGLSEERSALEGEPAVAVCARTERISGLLQGG